LSLEIAKTFVINKLKTKSIENISIHTEHLEGVVNRLKSLGITEQEILIGGMLYNISEITETTFDEIFERFGRKVAVIVSSLTKDTKSPRKVWEETYIKQLMNSPIEAKIILLCSISTRFKEFQRAELSKTKKNKILKKNSHILRVIKNELVETIPKFPKIQDMINGINIILVENKQRKI